MTSKSPGFTDTLDADDEAFCSACGRSYSIDYDHCPNDGALLTKFRTRPDLLIGRVFHDRYEVRSTLGHGGMGTVYRGWQLSVDREVAIKVIHARLASDRTAVKRFLREARLSSRLSQPSIVNVFDHGQTDDGILYIVMEMLRGHSLSKEVASGEAMPSSRVMTMALQLCDALTAAHGENIIHRDLKPGNVVVLDEPAGRDFIKVLDFGLAKTLGGDSAQVTNTDAILGTPLYMAPEQITSAPTDQRTDLYALGCLLYHMLSGRPPFTAETVSAVFARHIHDTAPPLPPEVPPALAAVVAKLMQKDPAKRFSSAMEARAALVDRSAAGSDDRDERGERSTRQGDDPNVEHANTVDSDDRRLLAGHLEAERDRAHANTVESDEIRHRAARVDGANVERANLSADSADRQIGDHDRPRRWKIAAVAIVLVVVAAGVFAVARHGSASQSGDDSALGTGSSGATMSTPSAGVVRDAAAPDAAVSDASIDAPSRVPNDAPIRRPRDAGSTYRAPVDAGPKMPIDASDDPGFIKPTP